MKSIVSIIDIIILNIIECIAALSALCLSCAPMYLEIREFAPAPIPFPAPTSTINSGVIYPNAASGSAPSPATHILSIMLFANISSILAIIGIASLFIAFLGSPVIISMFEFFSIIKPHSCTCKYILVYASISI